MPWKWYKNILVILTLRCDQASRLVSLTQEGPLNWPEKTALHLHLLLCQACRRYRRQLRLMRDVLGKLSEPQLTSQMASSLLDDAQSHALHEKLSQGIRKKMDSM